MLKSKQCAAASAEFKSALIHAINHGIDCADRLFDELSVFDWRNADPCNRLRLDIERNLILQRYREHLEESAQDKADSDADNLAWIRMQRNDAAVASGRAAP